MKLCGKPKKKKDDKNYKIRSPIVYARLEDDVLYKYNVFLEMAVRKIYRIVKKINFWIKQVSNEEKNCKVTGVKLAQKKTLYLKNCQNRPKLI